MSDKKNQKPEEDSTHFKRNVLLALIPVLGTIIVAIVTNPSIHCNQNVKDDTGKNIVKLRIQAGKLNDHLVFRRYDDLIVNMVEGLKPIITRDILNSDRDSVTLI